MQTIKINNKAYGFVKNYRHDEKLRASFNQLTQSVFYFDFENWYQKGYWTERYIPYSLVETGRVVSNISVNLIDFDIEGDKRKYVQIGTVMTAEEHRNKGLNRWLLEQVLREWRGNCDLIYLFANQSVLDFYPKFGFQEVQEYQFSQQVEYRPIEEQPELMDMTNPEIEAFVYSAIKRSQSHSKLAMVNNSSLQMFYLISFYSGYVYYLAKYDVLLVMNYEADSLFLMDIFSESSISLQEIFPNLFREETKMVRLGFTPVSQEQFDIHPLIPDDKLFVLDDRDDLCNQKGFMFPVLSHA